MGEAKKESRNDASNFMLETRRVEVHFMRLGKKRNPADLRDFKFGHIYAQFKKPIKHPRDGSRQLNK